jgi:hypothetical protein
VANEEKEEAAAICYSCKDLAPKCKITAARLARALLGDLSCSAVEFTSNEGMVGGKVTKADEVGASLLIVTAEEVVSRRLGDEEGTSNPDGERDDLHEGCRKEKVRIGGKRRRGEDILLAHHCWFVGKFLWTP